MKHIWFLFIICGMFSLQAQAKHLKITVSSDPLANIINLLETKDTTIEVISKAGMCSHEYILKPSDFKKAQNSDIIVYMGDGFEVFVQPLLKQSKAQLINLSKEMGLKNTDNMHIWMSLEQIKKVIQVIAQTLKQPGDIALSKIDSLISYKKAHISGPLNVLLLSDSLEYLFEDMPEVKVSKLYLSPGLISAKKMQDLSKFNKDQCIIGNRETIEAIASKISTKIVCVDSENWSIEEYKKLIDDIARVCKGQ